MRSFTLKRSLLLFVFFISFIPIVNAQFIATITKGNLSYTICADYSYAIVSGNSCPANSSVSIDSSISYNAHTIPVTEIGDYAFQGSGISSIDIPASVIKIGRNAFYNCTNLTSVYIEDSNSPIVFSSIGDECFGNDVSSNKCIQTLYIGRNIQYNTSRYPFSSQQKLTHVTFSDKVSALPSGLFYNCRSLVTITLPSSLKSIGSSVFAYCTSLRTVNNYESNPYLKSVSYYLFNGCSSLSKAYIPKNASFIDDHAFYACSSISSLYLPATIDTIGSSAFNACSSLSNIEIEESEKSLYIYNLGSGDFEGCPVESIEFGRNISQMTTAYHSFGNNPSLRYVLFSDKVTYIDDYLLYGDSGIESISIPGSITKVGKYAFDFCTGLKHLSFEQSDTDLYFYCNQSDGLKNNTVLESVTINRGINFSNETNSPFKNKSKLKDVRFGGSLRKLYGDLFSGSNAIQSITLDTDLTISGTSYLFGELNNLSTLTLGANCSSVPSNLYKSSDNLENVYCLSKEPATISDKFFNGLSLKVKVPDYCSAAYKSVAAWSNNGNNFIYCDNDYESIMTVDEFIEWAAVCDTLDRVSRLTLSGDSISTTLWTSLKRLPQLSYLDMSNVNCSSIPSSQFANSPLYTFIPPVALDTIGANAFEGCVNLHADFNFTTDNVVIGDYAFEGCEKLSATFNFGSDVHYVKIGKCAFRNCTNFSAPFAFTSRFDIGESAFENCSHISNVTFASSVADEAPSTFGDFAFANTAITKMTVPAYVDKLPKALWRGCESLSSVTISNADLGVKVSTVGIFNPDGSLYQILPAKISSNYTIPSSITAIGEYAFADLDCLQSVTIPETVTSIGAYAFQNCANLNKVTVDVKKLRYTPLTIPTSAFNGVYSHATLYLNVGDRTLVPKTMTSYMKATGWRSFKNIDSPTAQYVINVKSSSYGKITPSARVSEAGKTIALSATPIDGYTFVKFILSGATLSTPNSFVMPANEVTVDAEYKPSEPDFYHITVDSCANGKVEVSEQAAPDSQVSVSFVPVEGYTLQSWTLNGEVQSITAMKFTMPHKDVVIAATFAKIQSALTIDSINTGGVIMAFINNDTVQETSVKANWHDEVKLEAQPSVGYQFVMWNIDSSNSLVVDSLKNPITFLMPSSDVSVSATFEKMIFSVAVDSTIVNGSVVVTPQMASPGDTVALTIQPEQDFILTSWTAGEGVALLGDSAFIMPLGNVSVTATFERVKHHVIVNDSIVNGSVEVMPSSVAVYGDTIVVKANPESELYYFTRWTIVDSNGAELALFPSEDGSTRFVMPSCDVNVSAQFEQYVFHITSVAENGNIQSAEFAVPTDTVHVKAIPAFDYELVGWSAGDDVILVGDSAFVMPFRDVELSATFARQKHHIVVSDSLVHGNVSVYPSDADFIFGDTVTVIAETTDLYDFAGWQIDGLLDAPSDSASFTFVMPSNDVYVSASFAKKIFDVETIASEGGELFADSIASPLDTVRVLAVPSFDYQLVCIHAGDDVVVLGDTAFVMPFHSVDVSATFARQKHHVVVSDSLANGIVSVYPSGTDFVFGDSVTVVAEATELYDFAGWQIEGLSEALSDSSSISFVMPTNDVLVSASFVKKIFAIEAISSEGGMILVDSMASPRDTVHVELIPMDDYRLVEWSAGDGVVLLGDSAFVMPFGEVTLSASFVRLLHQVSADAQGHGSIVEGYSNEAVFGDTITIAAKPEDGYRFDGWVSDGLTDLPADSILTFTMPTHDVHVTAIFKVITYAIIKSDEMQGGTFEVMGGHDEAVAGDTIVLCAMADLGYDFDGWEIEGAEITYPLATTSFVMPAHSVTIKAVFKDATRISSLTTDWSVVLADNEIRVEGLQGSETVMVTSVAGAPIFEAIGNCGSVRISTIDMEGGTYILRVNQSIYKLFIH